MEGGQGLEIGIEDVMVVVQEGARKRGEMSMKPSGQSNSIAVLTQTIENIISVMKAKSLIEVSYWRRRSRPDRVAAVQSRSSPGYAVLS